MYNSIIATDLHVYDENWLDESLTIMKMSCYARLMTTFYFIFFFNPRINMPRLNRIFKVSHTLKCISGDYSTSNIIISTARACVPGFV